MPTNESRPVPKNPQRFVLPIVIQIDSDAGGVASDAVEAHLKHIDDFFSEEVFDLFDRDSSNPAPFALAGFGVPWRFTHSIGDMGEPYGLLVSKITRRQVRILQFAFRYLLANLDQVNADLPGYAEPDPTEDEVRILAKEIGIDL